MKQLVGVADMKISSVPEDEIVTYALGSCLGITVYDPVAKIGAMAHVMLPSSSIDPVKAASNPCMFVDSGVKKLFHDICEAGARKSRLIVSAAGGACANGLDKDDYFQIGKRNVTMLRDILWKNGIGLKYADFGGNLARTMSLDIDSGKVLIRSNGSVKALSANGGHP